MARCGTAASIRKIITSKVGQKCTLYVTRENDRGNDSIVEGKIYSVDKKKCSAEIGGSEKYKNKHNED